jgi:hypothetical protein
MVCDPTRYLVDKDIITMYVDTAKTYMNLSSAALALTIAFREKIVGARPGSRVSALLVASWLSFLVTIAFSAVYQYLAVKFLDSVSCAPGPIQFAEYLVRHPGKVYGLMLVAFFVSACILVLASWKELPRDTGSTRLE